MSRTLTKCAPHGGHSRLGGATSGALVVSTCGTGPADVVTTLRGFHGVAIGGGVLVLNSVHRLKTRDTTRRHGVISFLRRYSFRGILLIKRRFATARPPCRACTGTRRIVGRLRARGPGSCAVLVGKSGNVGLDAIIRFLWGSAFCLVCISKRWGVLSS